MKKNLHEQIESCRKMLDTLPQWCRDVYRYKSDAPPPEKIIANLQRQLAVANAQLQAAQRHAGIPQAGDDRLNRTLLLDVTLPPAFVILKGCRIEDVVQHLCADYRSKAMESEK